MANIHAIAGRLNGREAFLHEKSEDRHNVVMTIDDVEHYSNDEKKKIIASYPPHEAEARIKGIPVLGSGQIFPVAEETIAIDNRDFPSHWPRIGGMDFGWDQQLNFISTSTSTGYVVLTEMT